MVDLALEIFSFSVAIKASLSAKAFACSSLAVLNFATFSLAFLRAGSCSFVNASLIALIRSSAFLMIAS